MSEKIAVTQLVKRFGPLTAVDGIDMSVHSGEVLGFLGPNGAGKSTTMKMITGFLPPTAGDVMVDGIDVTETPVEAKRRIGYLPEGAPCYGDMTPRGFLNFIAEVRDLHGSDRHKAIDHVVARIELESVFDQPIETLSKGFKRRVGLAQAILHDPGILILDEPTDGLDPNQKHQVRTLITDMAKDKAVIISTHILEEVEAVCSRAVIIARGKILADGTPNDLLKRSPLHNGVVIEVANAHAEVVTAALGTLNAVGSVEQTTTIQGHASLSITSRDGTPIAPAIAALMKEQGHAVLDLKTEKGALDAVFREITRGQETHGQDQGAGHA